MPPKSVKLKEIAARLDMSVATVSRALNQKPGISAAARARIFEAAQEMGYMPDSAARALATDRTNVIGFIEFKYSSDTSFKGYAQEGRWSELIQGTDDELTRKKYYILTTFVDQESVSACRLPAMVLERRVDGVILIGPAMSADFILKLRGTGLPVVLIDNVLTDFPVDCVLWDNERGAYQAARHLIGHGHRQIVFLSGPPHWPSSVERANGYRRAMAEAALEPMIYAMPSTNVSTGQQAALAALQDRPQLTAILAVNDHAAFGAMQAIRQTNRLVPGDIAVAGFDDATLGQWHSPSLTTLRVPNYETGKHAARRILQIIDEPDQVPIQIRLPTELIIRQSCGCNGQPG